MIEKISGLYRHRFVRGVATLQSGYVILNIIQAGAGIILARFLGPEQFGIFTLAMGMAALSSAVIGIGIQDAIPTLLGEAYVRRDQRAVLDVSAFLIKVLAVIAILAIAAVFLMPAIAQRLYQNAEVGYLSSLVLFGSLFSSSLLSLAWFFYQVTGRVRQMTVISVIDQSTRYGFSVLFMLLGFGVAGAASGHLVGAIVVFLFSLLVIRRIHVHNNLFPSLGELFSRAIKIPFKSYLRFSVGVTVDRNIAILFSILPVFLTGIYVAASDVAYFKIAMSYMMLVLGFLGPVSVLLNVEFPKTKIEDKEKLRKNFIRVSLYSLGLSSMLTIAAELFGPLAIRIMYGTEYLSSVKYVYGLFLFGALFGIGVGLGPMWRALNLVRTSILINIFTLGIGIPLGVWLLQTYGLWGAVAMVTLWYTFSHFTSFFYLLRKLSRD